MADNVDAGEALTERAVNDSTAPEPEGSIVADEGSRDGDMALADTAVDAEGDTEAPASPRRRFSRLAAAGALGLLMFLAASGLAGWLGYRVYLNHQQSQRDALYVAVARQGAINLTTIDFTRADADVQRILDSATGTFYDDFAQRSQPFIAAVKEAKSKSEGTVAEASIESEEAGHAQVLVAVTVKTSTGAGAQTAPPRSWRMRIGVEHNGNSAKVANVEFVA